VRLKGSKKGVALAGDKIRTPVFVCGITCFGKLIEGKPGPSKAMVGLKILLSANLGDCNAQ
jgi:hypothetical protein